MNIRLDLEFDGTNYFGWQYQPNHPTVQGAIEQALNKLFGARVGVVGVGRTDTGVSAVNYTANFHPPCERKTMNDERETMNAFRLSTSSSSLKELRAVRAALNQLLPEDIRIKRARSVPDEFNARYSALSKLYRYTIALAPTAILRRQVWQVSYPIDTDLLNRGARLFLGIHDFAPFCRLRKQEVESSKLKVQRPGSSTFQPSTFNFQLQGPGFVNVMRATIRSRRSTITGEPLLQIEFQADRFLYKMVRRMVGALVDVGRGKFSLDDLSQAVETGPAVQFQTAPAAGLVLVKAFY